MLFDMLFDMLPNMQNDWIGGGKLMKIAWNIQTLCLAIFSIFVLQVDKAQARPSRCLAIAQSAPEFLHASYRLASYRQASYQKIARQVAPQSAVTKVALKADEVSITYVGHSTFRIESPGGVIIATDFTGYAGPGITPDIVTMNHAHDSHFTDYPDAKIPHALRGWNPAGGAAAHDVEYKDVKVRNVPTDIRTWSGEREKDGNSIFIFETAGLCIGHLGHLHHRLGPQYLGWIGQLDIVMVPVDGTMTMDQKSMVEVLKTLRARLIIPMHYFGPSTLNSFVAALRESFVVEIHSSATVIVSNRSLPDSPKVLVLPGG